jgi:hypothetical protein
MTTIIQVIWSVILWCLEGVYGSLRAAIAAPTDVPPLQCIIGSLSLAAFCFLADIGMTGLVKRIKKHKNSKWTE